MADNRLDLSNMEVYLVQWCQQQHGWVQRVEDAELMRERGMPQVGNYINFCPECGKKAVMFRTDFVGI